MTVNGVLLLDKAVGITSAQALTVAAKKSLQVKKAGHGGTLDPMACGLLILLIGEATRYASYLLAGSKRYIAELTFGYCSDTDDGDGTLAAVAPPPPDLANQVSALLPQFSNCITQTPPVYSAIKYQGKPLYKYARQGQAVAAKPRQVHIYQLVLLDAGENTVRLDITCGGGVYIRSLARDIGAAIGCGAYLSALRRTACGRFNVADAVTLEQLEPLTLSQKRDHLLPLETIVEDFPAITLPLPHIHKLGGGGKIAAERDDEIMRVLSPQGKFAGLVRYCEDHYQPLRFLNWTRQEKSQ